MRRHEHPIHGVSVELGPGHWVNARPNGLPFPGGWRLEEHVPGDLTLHYRAVPKEQALAGLARIVALHSLDESEVAA